MYANLILFNKSCNIPFMMKIIPHIKDIVDRLAKQLEALVPVIVPVRKPAYAPIPKRPTRLPRKR